MRSTPSTLRHRLKDLRSQRLLTLTATDLDPVRSVFKWHPSEASGLLLAAADGHRGYVQVRDAGDQIPRRRRSPPWRSPPCWLRRRRVAWRRPGTREVLGDLKRRGHRHPRTHPQRQSQLSGRNRLT